MRYSVFFFRIRAVILLCIILLMEALLINGLRIFSLQHAAKIEKQYYTNLSITKQISNEIQCFPVPLAYHNQITFDDSYGADRSGSCHEGCDIMSKEEDAGKIPIVSATDGVITNVGWLYLGGYRVGITTDAGFYYYYAHLDSYAQGIITGKEIRAGELLGFMGNTGEGEEGTKGKFPVHLHFAIYRKDELGNEESVNCYPFLRKIIQE